MRIKPFILYNNLINQLKYSYEIFKLEIYTNSETKNINTYSLYMLDSRDSIHLIDLKNSGMVSSMRAIIL